MPQEAMYDPPGGWRHGFPKPYTPANGEPLALTLVRDGYPADKAEFASKHCRFWDEPDGDTAARAAVEGLWRGPVEFLHALEQPGIYTHTLDSLQNDGFIYLGSPYSKQPDFDEAADIAAWAAARLMSRGLIVYAPIPHGHTIAKNVLPATWDFWKRQCDPFIDAASALVVLKLDGWRDSVGLTYEIARFHEAGKPIVYVTMEDLADG